MFDVVAADQHQAATAIHRRGVDHGQPRHSPRLGGAEAAIGEPADQPGGDADQRQNRYER